MLIGIILINFLDAEKMFPLLYQIHGYNTMEAVILIDPKTQNDDYKVDKNNNIVE